VNVSGVIPPAAYVWPMRAINLSVLIFHSGFLVEEGYFRRDSCHAASSAAGSVANQPQIKAPLHRRGPLYDIKFLLFSSGRHLAHAGIS